MDWVFSESVIMMGTSTFASYSPCAIAFSKIASFIGAASSIPAVYNQELGFYAFRQDNLSNQQWYKRFNTKVDVGESIGVNRQHKIILDYVAQELYTQTFSALTEEEHLVTREDAK